MLEIYVTRHGQDEDNLNGILNGRRDKPLTRTGKKQSLELAQKIKEAGITFDKVYCSPLRRTCKTAKIVTDELGMEEPEILDDLIERDFGIMTGRRVDEIEKVCALDIIKTMRVCYFLSPDGAKHFLNL